MSACVAFPSEAQSGTGHHEKPLNTLQMINKTSSSALVKIIWTLINLVLNRMQLYTVSKHRNYLHCAM